MTSASTASRRLRAVDPTERAALSSRLAVLAPFDGQLQVPDLRAGFVPRPQLVSQLSAVDAPPVVVLSAPTGYGKTSLLSEWAERDARPFAWVSLTETENNALTLLAYIARALDASEPLDDSTLAALTRRGADLTTTLLPRLSRALQARVEPVVLVLDDVHLLEEPACARVLSTLARLVPPGSQLALAGRSDPRLLVSRLRAERRLLRFSIEDLGLTAPEGAALVRAAGLDLHDDALDALVERADGWPAGLYLATIAVRGGGDVDQSARAFTGDDRVVADLLREEVLPTLPDATVDFLVRTSVLERLSGSSCDAILERTGSSELLEEIARSNLFLIPLDRSGEWYRYHHLFRDLLRAELRRGDPGLGRDLHARASAWYEAHGDIDASIRHGKAAGNRDRAAALIWSHAPVYLSTGRSIVVRRWLDLFSVDEIEAIPELALAAAWGALTSRDMAETEFWTVAAERAGLGHVLADGRSVRGQVALLGASVARHGLTRMAEDAALASELDPDGGPFRLLARYIEGVACRLLGDATRARELEAGALREAGPAMPTIAAQVLAQLALLDLDADSTAAERHIERARAIVREFDLRDHPAQVMVYSLSALALARRGDTEAAARDRLHARGLLGSLGDIAPWLAIEGRIVLSRVSLLLGDVATGRLLLQEAESVLDRFPDSGTLPDLLEHARKHVDNSNLSVGVIAAPLTTAELRVLRYLPTHLTLAAIAEELFVSRNTAKTHAIAVYRKLGVSSRQAAVEQARALGLLDDDR